MTLECHGIQKRFYGASRAADALRLVGAGAAAAAAARACRETERVTTRGWMCCHSRSRAVTGGCNCINEIKFAYANPIDEPCVAMRLRLTFVSAIASATDAMICRRRGQERPRVQIRKKFTSWKKRLCGQGGGSAPAAVLGGTRPCQSADRRLRAYRTSRQRCREDGGGG